MNLIRWIAVLLSLVVPSWMPLSAQQPAAATNEYLEVAGELRCPTCTGLSVLESDAPFSVQIKTQVKEQISEGKSKDEILKFFVDRYGPWILRAPPMQGVNSLAWIVPILVLVLGPVFIWVFVGRRREFQDLRRRAETVKSTEAIVEEMNALLSQLRTLSGGNDESANSRGVSDQPRGFMHRARPILLG